MPGVRDFDATRRANRVEREPVQFMLGGETFDVQLDPSLGDTFDLYESPEIRMVDGKVQFDPDRQHDMELVRMLSQFIERSLPYDDRARWQKALYRIPARESGCIIECAMFIVEQMTAFPTVPPNSSSSGRRTTGRNSKQKSGGATR